MTHLLDTAPTWSHGRLCICPLCLNLAPDELDITESGSYRGVEYLIEDLCGLFRVSVAGRIEGELETRQEARQLVVDTITGLIEQELVD